MVVTSSGSGPASKPRAGPSAPAGKSATPVASPTGPDAVEAGLLPWQLAAPISREVVLSGPGANELTIAGGLSSTGSSDSGVYVLDTTSGRLTPSGSLAVATHDAAGTLLGKTALVVGGGTASPSAVTQRFSVGGRPRTSSSLSQARADAAAVTIGSTAYVVGGYDGPSLDAEVLATTNGTSFTGVGSLAVPVRYPAVAALGGRIYVFGGQGNDGRPVRTVQVLDPATHKASVVGELPIPISGAAAAKVGGTIYLAGGESATGGSTPSPVHNIYAFDAARSHFLEAGSLPVPVTNAAAAVVGNRLWVVGGEIAGGSPTADVQMLQPNRRYGVAGQVGAGSPFVGDQLLVADRGNDRLLLLDASNKVIWSYPSKTKPAPSGGFYFPDDAFFIRNGTAIISNQEENETLVEIAYPSGRVVWQYGHPHVAGSAPGYLNNPDDAYLLRNGNIVVADPKNCRIVILSATKKVLKQIGTTGACTHNPPTELGSPNGDTPLADGNLLVSEINGSWIDEYTTTGHLVWSVHLPIGYPSDPQQVGPDRYLVADYENPGAIIEFNRAGTILYRYGPTSGPGMLNQPSLAEVLPSGAIMLNDDYNNRMVAIDPATGATVWQYGVTGKAGTTAGLINTPDGFDLLGPGGSTPTHSATG
ncbi:MAG: Kelch repeat-containing protein [Acidimicrobiaceae bacterium]|nr:Kelch repeat-containing protein [Acidimicrobiaceae bacterium]